MNKLISDKFNFREFINSISDYSLSEMVLSAQKECAAADKLSFRVRGSPAARAAGSPEYVRQLKQFLWFLYNLKRPAGVSPLDFCLYEMPVRHLAKLGLFGSREAEMLAMFQPDRREPR